MDDILKQIFRAANVKPDYIDYKPLGRVDASNNYYFTVSTATCTANNEKYLHITKYIQGEGDQSISIPILLVDPLIDLLLHANGKLTEDCKKTSYKAPLKKTFL